MSMSLDQVKYTYTCFAAFIMTDEHWLKQPKMLPCLTVVEYQTMKMHQPPQNSCKQTSLSGIGMCLFQMKKYLSMSTNIYDD